MSAYSRPFALVLALTVAACGGDDDVADSPDANPGMQDMCGDVRSANQVYYGTIEPQYLPMTAGRSELLTLHYDLLAGPLNYLAGKMHGFWPRVVVGRFADPVEFESAKKELAGFTLNLVVRVKQMELLYRKEVGQSWQSVKLFGLKATMAGRARHKK